MVTVVFVFTCYSAQNDNPLLLPVSVPFWCTQNSDNGFYHFIFYSTEQLNVVCVACCILWAVVVICVPFSHVQFSAAQNTHQTLPTHTKHSLHTPNTPYSESSITPHAVCLSLGLQQTAKFLDLPTAIHSKIRTHQGFKIVLCYNATKHNMPCCHFLQLQYTTKQYVPCHQEKQLHTLSCFRPDKITAAETLAVSVWFFTMVVCVTLELCYTIPLLKNNIVKQSCPLTLWYCLLILCDR